MATIKQAKAIKNLVENRGSVSKAMREAGYKDKTAKNPKNLTTSKAFKEVLLDIDDEAIVKEIRSIALAKDDKRAKLQAIDMLLKLKDRYPAQKSKVIGLFDKLSDITDNPDNPDS